MRMGGDRRLARSCGVTLLLASMWLVAAQPATSTGSDSASVAISGTAELGAQTSLRLPVPVLKFDLTGSEATLPDCALGDAEADLALPAAGLDRPQVAPAGTTLVVSDFPSVTVVGGVRLQPDALPPRDAAVVCYRTFLLGAYSNVAGWQLDVDRVGLPGASEISNLYVGAACPGGAAVGLYPLSVGVGVTLVSGGLPGECRDVLVAVGIKPAHELGGASTALLRYTLLAPAAGFGVGQ